MAELLKETFVYRVDTEEQAVNKVEEEKASSDGIVSYKVDYKEKKLKGEVVDSWYVVSITHDYTKK